MTESRSVGYLGEGEEKGGYWLGIGMKGNFWNNGNDPNLSWGGGYISINTCQNSMETFDIGPTSPIDIKLRHWEVKVLAQSH